MARYSFIMVCYNNCDLTRQALESLLESFDLNYKNLGVEVIIINNNSNDETFEVIQSIKADYKGIIEIVLVNMEENMGYSIGLNVGLSKATGKIITVLNNDLIFSNGWFKGLTEALDRDSSLGVAVPYLSYASGVQNVGVLLDSPQKIQAFASKFTNEHKGSIINLNRAIGACLTMKREVIDLIGGCDFWFGLGMYDDDDWCSRIRVSGYKIAVIGDSFVYHIGNATLSKNSENVTAAILSNCKKFMRKWNLKGNEYPEGLYTNRENSLENTVYERKKHFFPVKYEDYVSVSQTENIKNQINKCLLVADWTNFKSEWQRKLVQFLSNYNNSELHLWIPPQYFDKKEVMDKIAETVQNLENKENLLGSILKFNYDNISPDLLIVFMKQFDNVLTVENDYVNKFIVNLAKASSNHLIVK
jgi:GT2 family glycosyltransferase